MQQLPRWSQNLVINRKKLSLSQKDLAAKLSVGIKTLRSWEKGEHKPQPSFRQKISKLFETSIEDFGFLDDIMEERENANIHNNYNSEEFSNSLLWHKNVSFLMVPTLLVAATIVFLATKRRSFDTDKRPSSKC
jgi:transcriptional regulator with XRE-family HTH domain